MGYTETHTSDETVLVWNASIEMSDLTTRTINYFFLALFLIHFNDLEQWDARAGKWCSDEPAFDSSAKKLNRKDGYIVGFWFR